MCKTTDGEPFCLILWQRLDISQSMQCAFGSPFAAATPLFGLEKGGGVPIWTGGKRLCWTENNQQQQDNIEGIGSNCTRYGLNRDDWIPT